MSLRLSPRRIFAICPLILAALLPASGLLRADVIYTNFGVGDAYADGAGLIVTNDGTAWSSVATEFVPADNYNLTSIEFVATNFIPGGSGAAIGIFADNNGQPGGTPLESFSLDGLLGQFGDSVPVLTATSLLQPLLLADTPYWVGMQGPVGGLVVWNQNATLAGGISVTDGAGNWSVSDAQQGVVEIDGVVAPASEIPAPVTDPSSPPDTDPSLITDSLASQTTQEGPLPTPEPQAWWLTVAGLFVIARRRRTGAGSVTPIDPVPGPPSQPSS